DLFDTAVGRTLDDSETIANFDEARVRLTYLKPRGNRRRALRQFLRRHHRHERSGEPMPGFQKFPPGDLALAADIGRRRYRNRFWCRHRRRLIAQHRRGHQNEHSASEYPTGIHGRSSWQWNSMRPDRGPLL